MVKKDQFCEFSPQTVEDYSLYLEFARRLGINHSRLFPIIAKRLMTPDQAKVVLALPAAPEEISAKLGMSLQFVNDTLKEMAEKAVVVQTRKGCRMTGSVVQMHDGFVVEKWLDILGPDFLDLWAMYEVTERYRDLEDSFLNVEYPANKIIPKWQAIQDNPNLMPGEDIREIFKDRRLIGVNKCSCRRVSWNCSCQSPAEVCIFFDRIAEYQVERGNGRIISYEEALEIEDIAGDHNLISVAPNDARPGLVCHCGMDHCVDLRCIQAGNNALGNPGAVDWKEYYYRSRYQAVADLDKCSGCQTCLEKCVFGAIELKPAGALSRWKAWVNPDKCMGCGLCWSKCPKHAITLELVRPDRTYPESRALSGYLPPEERQAIFSAVKTGKIAKHR